MTCIIVYTLNIVLVLTYVGHTDGARDEGACELDGAESLENTVQEVGWKHRQQDLALAVLQCAP